MATSDTSIANLALQKLGSKRISSLTQLVPNATSMNACYEAVRDAEIRRYNWGFATKRAQIAVDPAQTLWGKWNRFALPGDYLRLIRDDETNIAVDWRIESGFIVTAASAPLFIRYIARIVDPTQFDSLFIPAFAGRLAMWTCEEITGSTTKKQNIQTDYDADIAEARRLGAIEAGAQSFPDDDWVNSRL